MDTIERRNALLKTVAEHLHSQGKAARDTNGTCKYRTYDGRKCAVGALIPDSVYDSGIEGCALSFVHDGMARATSNRGVKERRLKSVLLSSGIQEEDFGLLYDFQDAHDWADTYCFWFSCRHYLMTVAKRYGLDSSLIPPL